MNKPWIQQIERVDSDNSESSQEIAHIKEINKVELENGKFYGVEMKINGGKEKFLVDTGSPVTIIPSNSRIFTGKGITPLKEKYQDVNKN